MSRTILFDAPNIGGEEKESLIRIIDSGYVSTAGNLITEFEGKFARYLDLKKATAVQTGTAALHISLCEFGIGPGDEVIVPVTTFVASVNPILYNFATPVFVDVDPLTWNMDVRQIENHITKKTKIILPVHLYGNPCDMDAMMSIARAYKLVVIEDAAESLGATFKSRPTGTFGDLGCFSFNGNKIMTTGSGGMVVGKSMKRLDHIKFLVNQAKDPKRPFYHPEIGYNYRMTNLQAGLGLAQLEKLNDFLSAKKRFNKIYREFFSNEDAISFQENVSQAKSSCWLTAVLFQNKDVERLQKKLMSLGIPTRRNFMPMVEMPPYKKYKRGRCPNARRIYEQGLCLPSSTLNNEDNILYVCEQLKKLIK